MQHGSLTPYARYLATIAGSMLVMALAATFAIPAGADAFEIRSAAKATARISYGASLPLLTAKDFNIARQAPTPLAASAH
ncbi:MAG: hypothetical protein ACO1OK_13150 [Devosia sp.]